MSGCVIYKLLKVIYELFPFKKGLYLNCILDMSEVNPPLRPHFHKIANRYDLINHVLSFGIDYYWRYRTALRVAQSLAPASILVDLATGSGDLAFALQRYTPLDTQILGIDNAPEMLACAHKKNLCLPKKSQQIQFQLGDCHNLPFEDNSVDVLTIAFGLRNVTDRALGLQEMLRVLKRGSGVLWILEFSRPCLGLRTFHTGYLKYGVPFIGGILSGSFESYRYLDTSIQAFPSQLVLAAELKSLGFERVTFKNMTGGVVALHQAYKP